MIESNEEQKNNRYDEIIVVKPDGRVEGKYTSFGVIQAFYGLTESGKENVLRSFIEALEKNPALLRCVLKKKGKKPELWIESRLEKNINLPPKRVACECMHYLRIKREMLPYLIKLAQRVKRRLRKRLRAHGLYVPNSRKKSEVESSLGYWQ